jgi:hypothetical protein
MVGLAVTLVDVAPVLALPLLAASLRCRADIVARP